MTTPTLNVFTALNALASATYPTNPRHWWGSSDRESTRVYRCYICHDIIDTESANDKITEHAWKAIDDHALQHHDLGTELVKSGLWPVSTVLLDRTFDFYPTDDEPSVPGRLFVGVWCVSYGVFMTLNLAAWTADKVTRRKVMTRLCADIAFHDALDAAADVPSGVTSFLRSQGYAIKTLENSP